MNQLPLISLDSAAFGYVCGGQPIISDCTFTISKGEYAVLRGPNGCGKSTVIKGILGLALILKGKLQWNIGRKDAGYVPQESSISSTLPFTAYDIVKYSSPGFILSNDAIYKALETVKMERVMHSRFGSLSGGQKRRVLFARAIVTPPQILILDEPTANIDLNTETLIEELIETFVYKNGIAVLAVSHSRNFGKNARELILSEGTLHG